MVKKSKSLLKKSKTINNKKLKREIFKKSLKNELTKMGLKNNIEPFNFILSMANILIIFYLFYIFFISGIIHYINQIKDCKCFQEKNKLVGVNITYIYILEIIMLIISIIMFLNLLFLRSIITKIKNGGNKSILTTNKITYLLSLIVNGYLIYNIVKISEIPTDDCECDKSWLKNLLYIQVIIICISIFFGGIIALRY